MFSTTQTKLKRGQKVIQLVRNAKDKFFYHSLRVQVAHKYIFERKKKKLNKRKNITFY